MGIVSTLNDKLAVDEDILKQLLLRGNYQFRFNASYMPVDGINRAAEIIHKLALPLNIKLQLIVDIPGIKRRIGKLAGEWMIINPQTVVNFELGKDKTNNRRVIPIPEADFFEILEIGNKFLLKDGKIKFLIKSIDFNTKVIKAQSLSEARIKSFFGYSLYLKNLDSLGFPERNWKILSGLNYDLITHVAVSYTESAEMLHSIRERLLEYNAKPKLIAKIEEKSGFDHIMEIDFEADVLWFCRGDFGNNLPLLQLYQYEKKLLKKIPQYTSPFYIAGENFMGILHDGVPSRAEISHAGFLFEHGINGMVLSDEITNSKNPVDVFLLADKLKKKYSKFLPGQVMDG